MEFKCASCAKVIEIESAGNAARLEVCPDHSSFSVVCDCWNTAYYRIPSDLHDSVIAPMFNVIARAICDQHGRKDSDIN